MKLHGDKNEADVAPRLMNMSADGFATNQPKVIPLLIGEGAVPAMWVGSVYDQETVEAPSERPGKK